MLRQALAANLNKRQRRLQDIDVGREIFLGRREAVGVAMGVVAVLVLLLVIAWVSFTQVGGRQQLDGQRDRSAIHAFAHQSDAVRAG